MHLWLGTDQSVVEPLERRIGALCKGVMLGLFNGVVGIASGAANLGDGVAGRAGDAGLA